MIFYEVSFDEIEKLFSEATHEERVTAYHFMHFTPSRHKEIGNLHLTYEVAMRHMFDWAQYYKAINKYTGKPH